MNEVMRLWREAGDQGHVEAIYCVGGRFAFGEGVKQDSVEAVRWFRKAAEQGYANAQFNLGVSYSNGEG